METFDRCIVDISLFSHVTLKVDNEWFIKRRKSQPLGTAETSLKGSVQIRSFEFGGFIR